MLPHAVDTVLLLSALGLAWLSQQWPFAQAWLTAKVLALVLYIVLGTLALKRARTLGARITAFVAAFAVYLYIVGAAISRSPWSWSALY